MDEQFKGIIIPVFYSSNICYGVTHCQGSITALGVGGLAVALALQDTLVNLFAGLHILMEKSIRVGDFIRIETGQEGYVEDITWRTTRIKMQPNNMIVIPNSKLSQSVQEGIEIPFPHRTVFIREEKKSQD